jgi:hypothetical protein
MSDKTMKRRTTLKLLGSATAFSGTALGSKGRNRNAFAGVAYDMQSGEILNEVTAEITKRRKNLRGELKFDQTPTALETDSLSIDGSQLLNRQVKAFPADAGRRFNEEVGKKSFSDFSATVPKAQTSERRFPIRIQASSVDNHGVSGVIKPTVDHTDRFAFSLEPVTANERPSSVVADVRNNIAGLFSGGDS